MYTTVMILSHTNEYIHIYFKSLQFSSVVSTKGDVSVWEPDTEEGGHSC